MRPVDGQVPWTWLPSTIPFLSPSLFPAVGSHHLHPLSRSHCSKSCAWVAFSKQPLHCCWQVWSDACVSWCSPCWQGPLGPTIAQLSAVLALSLLPLCCPHPSSFKSDLVSSVSPTMLLGEHTYGLFLLPYFMKWYSGQKGCTHWMC